MLKFIAGLSSFRAINRAIPISDKLIVLATLSPILRPIMGLLGKSMVLQLLYKFHKEMPKLFQTFVFSK